MTEIKHYDDEVMEAMMTATNTFMTKQATAKAELAYYRVDSFVGFLQYTKIDSDLNEFTSERAVCVGQHGPNTYWQEYGFDRASFEQLLALAARVGALFILDDARSAQKIYRTAFVGPSLGFYVAEWFRNLMRMVRDAEIPRPAQKIQLQMHHRSLQFERSETLIELIRTVISLPDSGRLLAQSIDPMSESYVLGMLGMSWVIYGDYYHNYSWLSSSLDSSITPTSSLRLMSDLWISTRNYEVDELP